MIAYFKATPLTTACLIKGNKLFSKIAIAKVDQMLLGLHPHSMTKHCFLALHGTIAGGKVTAAAR
jgi:hypothetical protein